MPTAGLPVLSFPPEVLLRAQGVRVAFFDVDGVLTDGGLYIGTDGEALKRFHTLDGHGLKLLQAASILPVVISGRDSPALRARLAALGIAQASFGCEDKLPAAQQWLARLGAAWAQAAAIGDDWPDLPLLRRAALAVAPPGAHAEVLAVTHWTTRRAGGDGAAREFCDLLLTARGHYRRLLEAAQALPPGPSPGQRP